MGVDHKRRDQRAKAAERNVVRLDEPDRRSTRTTLDSMVASPTYPDEQEHDEPAHEQRQQQAQFQRRNHADHGRRALAAAKARTTPDRRVPRSRRSRTPAVSHSRGRLRDRCRRRAAPPSAATTPPQAFGDVDEQHQKSEQLALRAQGVGGARIAAAHAANIDAAQPAQNQAAQQRAEQVGNQQL